jgi:deoxyadenosine/deoxycytidine kinase
LERKEATAILKEIIDLSPEFLSFVTLIENDPGKFDIVIKGDCDLAELKSIIAERKLKIEENMEEGYYTIFKPNK